MKHSHYRKDVKHLDTLDVYRVLDLFNVTNPALQHAVKKLLCAGQRGAKTKTQDWQEAIDSIQRAIEMDGEDGAEMISHRALPRLDKDNILATIGEGKLDGWIRWDGGKCPVHPKTEVQVMTTSNWIFQGKARDFNWGPGGNVPAYRIVETA